MVSTINVLVIINILFFKTVFVFLRELYKSGVTISSGCKNSCFFRQNAKIFCKVFYKLTVPTWMHECTQFNTCHKYTDHIKQKTSGRCPMWEPHQSHLGLSLKMLVKQKEEKNRFISLKTWQKKTTFEAPMKVIEDSQAFFPNISSLLWVMPSPSYEFNLLLNIR